MGLEFRVLGPFELIHNGIVIDPGPYRQRALLALLLINANNVVSTDRIIEEFWGDDPDGKESTLWVYISRLRSVLEPDREKRAEGTVLARHDHGYKLNVAPGTIDAQRFVALTGQAASLLKSDPDQASNLFQDAIGLWRGNAFEEFQYEPFAEAEVAQLEELRTKAIEDRIDADLRSGKAGELVAEIEHYMQSHPLRERPVAQLMLALYRSGRPADALRAYSRFNGVVGDELGIEPSPELASLEEQILLHDSRLWVETQGRPDTILRSGEARNPYKGLEPFRAEDAADFFGRERLVAETLRRIKDGAPLIALVGASGSGKTSAVRAGVIPALESEGLDEPHGWVIADMVPGARPFAELEAAFNRATPNAPGDLMELLLSGPEGLLRAVLRVLGTDRQNALLFVDQFEELYTLIGDPDDRTAFLDALTDALTEVHHRLTVVITLRADFYEKALTHAAFSDLLGSSILNVSSMLAQELEAAALLPAQRAGSELDPALLTALITDVIGEPGALPVFQHTLRELYDRRDGNRMTLAAYEASGGVRGMLSTRAEDIYRGLDPGEQEAAKQVFLRLATITDSGERTKRRVLAGELLSLDLPAVAIEAILAAFSSHRLVSFDRDHVTSKPVAEIAHEALLSGWPRLSDWIDKAEDDMKRHARLSNAIDEWEEAGCDPDYLFTGHQLHDYSVWAGQTSMLLTSDQQAFLDKAAARELDQLESEQSRSVRESDLGKRARRRLGALVAALGLLIAFLAVFTLSALDSPPTLAVVHAGRSATDTQISEGIARAQSELGVDVIEVVPPFESLDDEVAAAVEAGAELIIVDEAYQAFVSPLSAVHPDVEFEILQRAESGAGYAIEEGAFLLGVIASLEAFDPTVGFVGSVQDRRTERLRAGFEAGVHHVRPSVEILAGYALASGWPDPGRTIATEAAATAQFERGADIVFNAAQDVGVLEAAFAQTATGRHVYSIGAFTDEYFAVAPDRRIHVLSSLVPRYDGVVFSMISNYLTTGDATSEREWSVADGAMSYSRAGNELSAVVDREIELLIEQIRSGEIEVPIAPSGELTPIPGDYDEVEATVRYDGTGCLYQGPAHVPIGTVVTVEFINNAASPAMAAIGANLPIEITAAPGSRNRGQVAMLEDDLPIRCEPLLEGPDAAADADTHPQWNVLDEEIDVVVTVTNTGCEVETRRNLVDGDLVGFMTHSTSAANGATYTWLAAGGIEEQGFSPDFEDPTGLWRWQEIGAGDTEFYARRLTIGSWGVGCWRDAGQREHWLGTVLEVAQPSA